MVSGRRSIRGAAAEGAADAALDAAALAERVLDPEEDPALLEELADAEGRGDEAFAQPLIATLMASTPSSTRSTSGA